MGVGSRYERVAQTAAFVIRGAGRTTSAWVYTRRRRRPAHMKREYYSDTIAGFLATSPDEILGEAGP